MQRAALMERAPATSRECRGHNGNRFVPVPTGDGHWTYYWLTTQQARFWRSREEEEKASLVRSRTSECFVCRLQTEMEKETEFVQGLYAVMMKGLTGGR